MCWLQGVGTLWDRLWEVWDVFALFSSSSLL